MGFFSSLLSQTWKPDSSKEELDVFEKAEIYTNIQNLHKVAQDLLEKGYYDQGVYLSTKMMFLEKNSDDPKNVPYTKWLVGMDSKIRNVGYPFTYWDIATHINYKNLSFWDNAINVDRFRVDIKIDSKPNVKKNRQVLSFILSNNLNVQVLRSPETCFCTFKLFFQII